MSWQTAKQADCASDTGCTPVELVIEPRAHELGGFEVRRALPVRQRRMVGPFVFFDHMGPATLGPDQPINVRPHPHIGLSTLTWLFEGSIMHRDSLGIAQEIQPGEFNSMTAGSGIVHSERTPERLLGQSNHLHGLQIWMALPKDHEETAPAFQHYKADQLPVLDADGVHAVVVAGRAWGLESPVSVYSDTVYVDIDMSAGAQLSIGPEHGERALYLVSGELEISGTSFAAGRMLVLRDGLDVTIRAAGAARVMLLGGARMDGPRHMYWNFVSSDRARIEQAKRDWREGRFAKVPGDSEEFIPLPED